MGVNPGESIATEGTVNSSWPVFVTRTCTWPPIAWSVRSRTASASMPGTGGTAGPVESDAVVAADDDSLPVDAPEDPQAAVSATARTTAVRLMAAQPRSPRSRFGYRWRAG